MSTTVVSLKESNESLYQAVEQALRGLRYGSVELVVHDARVVQIERRERVRLENKKDSSQGE
jgi:hypothetical protein